MPTVLLNPERVQTSYHDDLDPKRMPLVATKVVDISDRCTKEGNKYFLIYARCSAGSFVELRSCRADEVVEPHVNYFYENMSRQDWRWKVDVWASCWGIGECELIQLIYNHAPQVG